MKWEILNKSLNINHQSLSDILLANRGVKSKKDKDEFLNSSNPTKIGIKELGISDKLVEKVIKRIKKAKKNKEFVIIYGDYDADGITATAILWETLHEFGLEVLPYIPDRFEDGYGIKPESVEKLKRQFPNLSLIITVDNGIVAHDGIKKAKGLKIDSIVVDHHQKGSKKLDTSYLIHNTSVCGSALAWFLSKEIIGKLKLENSLKIENWKLRVAERLGLAAIGTIADQMPLTKVNRSLVKYGLEELNITRRPGIQAILQEAKIEKIGVYEVGFMIAPRINAMGRLKHGLESLRLLCTKNKIKALEIAENVGKTNKERQKIVDDVLLLAKKNVTNEKIIVIAGENYHEGVIGLAAGKLVEEFYRPAIVFSTKGEISKASARSVSGFNIIEAIRAVNMHLEGGGHPMAAGFSLKSSEIEKFSKAINKFAKDILTDEILQKRIKIDCGLNFDLLDNNLIKILKEFEPVGIGNPGAVFLTKNVELINAKPVGRESKHLKLKFKQNEHIFDSIFFGGGENYSNLPSGTKMDIVYSVEENTWNGYVSIQLKIKDIKII